MSIKDLPLGRSFFNPEIPDPLRWAPGFGDLRPAARALRAHWQAEEYVFRGEAPENMI